MNLEQWADFVNGCMGELPKYQRRGQWVFNLLYEVHPNIANEIRGSKCDPFYRDELLPDFFQELLEYVKRLSVGSC